MITGLISNLEILGSTCVTFLFNFGYIGTKFWKASLLHFWVTCGLYNSKVNIQMHFFTAVNQMLGRSSQLTTTVEHCFVVS